MAQSVGIVPLDGSATAERVIPWAVTVARALDLKLLLVRFVQESMLEEGEDLSMAVEAAGRYLDGVAEPLRGQGLMVETRALPGGHELADNITALAAETDAALILIGSHGYSGFDRWALGSVADAVVRTAACPVLVVCPDPTAVSDEQPAIERILVPLDGFPPAEEALPEAVRLAAASGAVLELLHVIPEPWAFVGDMLHRLGGQLKETARVYLTRVQERLPASLRTEQRVLTGSPATTIVDHAERSGADLIVMTTHGRSGVSRWVLGSVADRVLRGCNRPVLLVRPKGHRPDEAALFLSATARQQTES
jgi:nucleotide-binding universal stress UspA family protein